MRKRNNPSTAKEVAKLLGTDDKEQQLQIIKYLLHIADVTPAAVIVFQSAAGIQVTAIAPANVTSPQAKALLSAGIDYLTRQEVLGEQQRQEQQVAEALAGPPDEPQDDEAKTQVYYEE